MTNVPSWVEPLLRCPACRGMLDVGGRLTCRECSHSYPLSPIPLLLVDQTRCAPWGPEIHEAMLERRRSMFRRMAWIGDEMIARLEPGSMVLSVGEGYGEIALRLAERRADLRFVASDLAPERIEWAQTMQKRLGLENLWLCVADATQLPFADASFTAGYARGLLQVFSDPTPAVSELRRVLRMRLIVDQLGNRPFLVLWFWLFQRYENMRARFQRRPPNRRIWGEVEETLPQLGAYWPLWRYRRWFAAVRRVRVRANCLFIWETGRHHSLLGWCGYAGALDVQF